MDTALQSLESTQTHRILSQQQLLQKDMQKRIVQMIQYYTGKPPKDLIKMAVRNNDAHVLEDIIQAHGAGDSSTHVDELFKDAIGGTLLHWAAAGGHTVLVKELIQKGANHSFLNNLHHTPLHERSCSVESGHISVVETLLESGANASLADQGGVTALHYAAGYGHVDVVKALLGQDGVDVNAKEMDGYTALHCAASMGFVDVVKALLGQDGVDVNASNSLGETALLLAALEGHLDIVKTLLRQADVHINATNNRGETALHLAAQKGPLDIVHTLLGHDKKMDINARDKLLGETALHKAAEKGRLDVVNALLGNDGMDINAMDSSGNTPLDVAQRGDFQDVVRALIAVGDVTSGNDEL